MEKRFKPWGYFGVLDAMYSSSKYVTGIYNERLALAGRFFFHMDTFFDPYGWFLPLNITARLILKKRNWDEIMPDKVL